MSKSRDMSALDKYNTPPPRVNSRYQIDNPLLPMIPRSGVPLSQDDFVDSTDQIINGSDLSVSHNKDQNIWSVDVDRLNDNSGLAGIDMTPSDTKKFDLGRFNKEFERNKEITLESQRLKDLDKLNALAQETERVSLYDLSLLQIIVNAKDSWFNLLDDLLDQRFELSTFTKDNRLFYIGLTIIVFAIILYLYTTISADGSNTNSDKNVQVVYHVHNYPIGGVSKLSEISDFSAYPSQPIIGQQTITQSSVPIQSGK